MRRHSLIWILLLMLASGAFAQIPGVDRNGAVKVSETVFIDRYGERVMFPRLNQYGQNLHYAPLVAMDSVRLSETAVTTAVLYGELLFDGWSPVLSCGFDYASSSDFSDYQRKTCGVADGMMTAVVSELSYNQQYFVRSFATNRYGTTFADTLSFRTTVGPVVIESVQTETTSPYSFDVTVRLGERGGLPISGNIALFTDSVCQNVVANEPIANQTSNQLVRTFPDLAPATTYYARTILTNGLFADTVFSEVRTPSDLVLSIVADQEASVSLCTDGTSITYSAVLTGLDANKPHYDFRWTTATGTESLHDSSLTVLYETAGTYGVSVMAFYEEDTLYASMGQEIRSRVGRSSFYVCTNEFLNTADATTTNIASIRWLNEQGETVATTKSVKLPTGYYTVECTDNYGCVLRKTEYVGKKKISCNLTSPPGSNESGHLQDGVWKLDSVQDHDGNWYAVTQIGTQCWTRQFCRARHAVKDGIDLWNGGNDVRHLYYPDYNPETQPYEGAYYSWAAAMDTSRMPSGRYFDFTSRRRGLCPLGWHIPMYEETWDMIEAVYNLYGEGIEPLPPLRYPFQCGGANAPLEQMLTECCYESLSHPAYPKEIYDASHLSLQIVNVIGQYDDCMFWIGNCIQGNYVSYVLQVYGSEDENPDLSCVTVSALPREAVLRVRCIRD